MGIITKTDIVRAICKLKNLLYNRSLAVIHSSSNILLTTNTMIMKSELKNVRDVMNKSIISVDKDDAINKNGSK